MWQAKDIESYSSDPAILALAEQFCTSRSVSVSISPCQNGHCVLIIVLFPVYIIARKVPSLQRCVWIYEWHVVCHTSKTAKM